jgi:ADP-ribose pyrophosphatase
MANMNMINDDKNLYWKVLESEYLFREPPWFTARRDKVELPNGTIMPAYYVFEYPEWINVIAITKDKKFVFVRQYRHAIGSVNYELCAGVVEKDEQPEAAARRELLEETGFGGGTWEEMMTLSGNASTMNNSSHCFIARDVEKIDEQHLEDTEMITVHLLEFDEVKELLNNNKIRQATMVAPLWRFIAKGQSRS